MSVALRMGLRMGMSQSNLLCATVIPVTQTRGILGKVAREAVNWPPRPPPFPYKTKYYSMMRSWIDRTTNRFNENSKVICVEGPIAAGKTAFAKQLADDLDMLHFPEPNLDLHYITPYGYDLRTLDALVPKDCRSYDHTNFCRNPNDRQAAAFQLKMYSYRYSQYLDALTHLLNTGQGVVLERSPYSDIIFAEAMVKSKFMRKEALEVYNAVKLNTITELMKPHLVIYLDVPVSVIQKRVKQRNLPHEQNSKVMSTEHLTNIERCYKQIFLKDISRYSELLVYDWSEQGDAEVVVEDIERIDFNNYIVYDLKCEDWRLLKEQNWSDVRQIYTNEKPRLMNLMNVPLFHVDELITSAEDVFERNKVYMEKIPGMKYAYGYNQDAGDSNFLFKYTTDIRDGK